MLVCFKALAIHHFFHPSLCTMPGTYSLEMLIYCLEAEPGHQCACITFFSLTATGHGIFYLKLGKLRSGEVDSLAQSHRASSLWSWEVCAHLLTFSKELSLAPEKDHFHRLGGKLPHWPSPLPQPGRKPPWRCMCLRGRAPRGSRVIKGQAGPGCAAEAQPTEGRGVAGPGWGPDIGMHFFPSTTCCGFPPPQLNCA